MHLTEVTSGRRLVLALEPGDEVLTAIAAACRERGVAQAAIVVLSGALRSARLIATHEPIDDPEAPLADEIEVRYTEGIGSGTVSSDDAGQYTVHVHVALGEKADGARATAGHLLHAVTHYVVEVVLDEILTPRLTRRASEATHGIPALSFEDAR
ncbi:DNA-binding protein [Microbacterium sp. LRZ72]|uniref:PPC domain-containing DNA-binding protein n=1 Tax=Microbacterium sp. LRZ72 TaxID=2942481 RepID=UPI0029A29918|nr:PPC domain-containing DNA-binding protein [Microbacterium sp. LRZ72]MDX2377798.1 DNA-binding protein [Microbacterium sp. LRZ72]